MRITLQENFLGKFQTSKEWILFVWLTCMADKEGNLTISQSAICDALSMSRQEIRTLLQKLESNQLINQRATNQATNITILLSEGYTISQPTKQPTSNQRSNQRKTPEEEKFDAWMKANYPRVSSMKKPLTLEGMKRVQETYPDKNEIVEVLFNMENWQPLHKKNVDAKATLMNWLKMKHEREEN